MSPELTFLSGLFILILFGWYFATHHGRAKRILGSTLTVLLVALSIVAVYPPNKAIRIGLDLQGGTSF